MTFGVSRVCPMLQGDLVLVFFIKFTTEFSEFGRATRPSRLWVAVLHKGFGFLRSCHGRIPSPRSRTGTAATASFLETVPVRWYSRERIGRMGSFKHSHRPGRRNESFHNLPWGRLLHNERKSSLRESYNRSARVYSGDSPHKRAGTRRCLDDRSAPGHSSRPQAHRRGTQRSFFPISDEPGVVCEHRWSHSSAAPRPSKPTRSPPRRRSSLARGHRRRLDLGRKLISMVRSDLPNLPRCVLSTIALASS